MVYIIDELCGDESFPLAGYDTREEAEHAMIELAGNDVTQEWGEIILESDALYQSKLTEALTYYAIREEIE